MGVSHGIVFTLIYVWICLKYKLYAIWGSMPIFWACRFLVGYVLDVIRSGWEGPASHLASSPSGWLIINRYFLLPMSFYILCFPRFYDSDVPYWIHFTHCSAFVICGWWPKEVENWIALIYYDLVSVRLLFLSKGYNLNLLSISLFSTVLGYLGNWSLDQICNRIMPIKNILILRTESTGKRHTCQRLITIFQSHGSPEFLEDILKNGKWLWFWKTYHNC